MNTKFNQSAKRLSRAFLLILIFAAVAVAQWQRQKVETNQSLRGLSVVNQNVVWASGAGGTFLRTTDAGKTWKIGKVAGAEQLDFRDVEAFDANTAYLLSIGNGASSRIYKTIDGGENWTLQFENKDEKAFFDALAFWDRNNGIAMSDPVDNKYLLVATSDGGQSWKPLVNNSLPDALPGEAAFAASGTCLIANGAKNVFLVSGGQAARVFRSNNRGLKWFAAETPIAKGTAGSGIFSIAMFDNLRGAIVGGNYEKPNETANNLALTTDGGKTWRAATGLNGYRSGVAFVDRNTLIAVGSNGSDISRDTGKTWTNLDKENYNSVQAAGKNAIWAVGANGLVSRLSPELQIKRFPARRATRRRRS